MQKKHDRVTQRRETVFSSTIENTNRDHDPHNHIPFPFLKRFVTKMNSQPREQCKMAAQCAQLYKNHPDYVITEKEVNDLLPNMQVAPNNRALAVFGVRYKETIGLKKYYSVTPLLLIYAVLLNTCNDMDFNEKVKFAFNMSDDDQDGLLSREDVWKLLSYQNEENSIGLQDPILDEMVDAIFEELDTDRNGYINLEEFTYFYQKFKEANVVISAERRRTATIDNEPRAQGNPKKNTGCCFYLKQHLVLEGTKYFWVILYLVGLAITAWWYFKTYYGGIVARGVAKMFSGMISYNLAFIVLIINRSFISFLRVVPFLPKIFPINKNIVFHKYMATMMIICAIGHACAHLFGTFILISTTPIEELNSYILYSPMPSTPSWGKLLFATVPGLTGIFLLIGFILMICLARKPVRAKHYEVFWYSHHLYIVMLILLQVHGMKEYIAPQTYWRWIYAPVLLLIVEKIFKFYKTIVYRYHIIKIKLSSGVVELELRRPRNFVYTAGQYVLINFPQISKLQWHSFTISSCPTDRTIHFYISQAGWWTKQLVQIAKDYEAKKIKTLPTVRIDGPWGAPSQHYEDFKHLMIISSGIGATPFCSILREILCRLRRNDQRLKFKEIDFFWINRKPQNTKWLNKVLLDLRQESKGIAGAHLNLYIFYTGAHERYDFRSFMLWNGFQFMKDKGRLTSEKMANFDCMHWGRPDWDDIFARISQKHKGKKVGVFMCGNKILCKEIYSMCGRYSDTAKFHFSKENFG